VTVRATASNVELVDDRWEPHSVQQYMFVPTSQFHLYGHVTSDERPSTHSDDSDDDDDDDRVVDDAAAQLAVICRAARDVVFYLVNVFLILVLPTT